MGDPIAQLLHQLAPGSMNFPIAIVAMIVIRPVGRAIIIIVVSIIIVVVIALVFVITIGRVCGYHGDAFAKDIVRALVRGEYGIKCYEPIFGRRLNCCLLPDMTVFLATDGEVLLATDV